MGSIGAAAAPRQVLHASILDGFCDRDDDPCVAFWQRFDAAAAFAAVPLLPAKPEANRKPPEYLPL